MYAVQINLNRCTELLYRNFTLFCCLNAYSFIRINCQYIWSHSYPSK